MRVTVHFALCLLLLGCAVSAAAFRPQSNSTTKASCECKEWTKGVYTNTGVSGRNLNYYYRPGAAPFGGLNEAITKAIIVLHGAGRNAQEYFCYLENSVNQHFGHNAANVLTLAPHFQAEEDSPAKTELFWTSNGWRICDQSSPTLSTRVPSCTLIDQMLLELTDPARHPNLKRILIGGHSAGGQLTNRYAASSSVPDTLKAKGIAVRFAVMNPSSYLYLDGRRPVPPVATSSPGLGSLLPHLHRDWAHPTHICTGTGSRPCRIWTGSGLARATSAPGLGSLAPLTHLHRDWARRCHTCTGTELARPISAPGLG
jgi:hypothetical protein